MARARLGLCCPRGAAQWGGARGRGLRISSIPWLPTAGMFPAQEEADRTVFVGNLEARVREEILYELFLQVPSAGKAGRRLGSPGTPPHRRQVSLPSLGYTSAWPGMSGPFLCSPGWATISHPNPTACHPLARAAGSSAGPGCAAEHKTTRHCPQGIVSTLVSNLNMVPVPGHYPFFQAFLVGKAVYSRLLQVITDWVPW